MPMRKTYQHTTVAIVSILSMFCKNQSLAAYVIFLNSPEVTKTLQVSDKYKFVWGEDFRIDRDT
jgi:hypothetical protein